MGANIRRFSRRLRPVARLAHVFCGILLAREARPAPTARGPTSVSINAGLTSGVPLAVSRGTVAFFAAWHLHLRCHCPTGQKPTRSSTSRALRHSQALPRCATRSALEGNRRMWNPLNWVFGLFSRDLGIDLGTANTLVYVRGK